MLHFRWWYIYQQDSKSHHFKNTQLTIQNQGRKGWIAMDGSFLFIDSVSVRGPHSLPRAISSSFGAAATFFTPVLSPHEFWRFLSVFCILVMIFLVWPQGSFLFVWFATSCLLRCLPPRPGMNLSWSMSYSSRSSPACSTRWDMVLFKFVNRSSQSLLQSSTVRWIIIINWHFYLL